MNHNPQTPPPLDPAFNAATEKWAKEERYSIFDWFKKALRNFTNFSGRARRKEYWYFTLVATCFVLVAAVIDTIFDMDEVIFSIVSIIFAIPSIAVTIRRLHDINKSGWWYLISIIPLIGSLIILFWTCKDTHPNTNQWGLPARKLDL